MNYTRVSDAYARGTAIADRTLLLQLERAEEALEDRVEKLEDPDDATCDCYDRDIERIDERILELNRNLLESAEIIGQLVERVVTLESNQDKLLVALERTLLG